jgi:2-methylisocitrate lyase-like PEP mutase family enzyme
MSKGRKFKTLIRQNKYLVTPGITTPLHAKIVEKAGFKFAYVGGHDVSITLLGLADAGFLTETEMVANARHIAAAVDIPVMVDADTGYGNAINVMRAVRDFEAAGVAAMQIEDQESPKRCGYVPGATLVSTEEAVGKLKAAMDARRDQDFMIVGRTDAISAVGGGLDEAITRGKAFAAAGCDMIMPIFSSPELDQPRLFAEALHAEYPDAILYFLYASAMKWHETRVTFDDIAALGYKAMHVSLSGLRLTMQPFWDYAVDMRQRGAEAEFDLEERMAGHPMADIFGFEGFPEIRELEVKYLPADAVGLKYGESGRTR